MPAFPRALGAAVWEDMSAAVFVNHANAATNVTRLAGMTQWMLVDSADHVTRPKTGCGIDLHCHRGALGQERRNMLGLEGALRGCVVCWTRGLSGRQFLCGHEARFEQQFFQPREPVFVIGMPQIIDRMLPFSCVACHVDVPFV